MTVPLVRRLMAARHVIAVVGLITALAGVGLDDRRVTGVAIVLLGVAAVLRVIWVRLTRGTEEHS